ncbi:hypothetical protein E2562_001249 [Oryza meyeriana var. granulata]|uniref:H(+)-exporting diphosphatase n=1 Tax=Oryza meyeriana var. granulata TaxID=110450 RepID=A0A6G1DC92_9ORYZ|nr:hypothetical protein E2562_001249 [Oryza meyeriana var. granulata]
MDVDGNTAAPMVFESSREGGGSRGRSRGPFPPSLPKSGVPRQLDPVGVLSSVLSGYLRMRVATFRDTRTMLEVRRDIGWAFEVAFWSGAAMGFLLSSSTLLILFIASHRRR